MKLNIALTAAAVLLAAAFTGCKTTEANYRSAYEIARQKQESADAADPDMMPELNRYNRPQAEITASGDTLMTRTEPVRYEKADGASDSTVMRLNIVVGQFHQIFNARAMRKRLIEAGYPGACVVRTLGDVYYVIAGATDSESEAAALLRRVRADSSMRLREPLPFVLRARR